MRIAWMLILGLGCTACLGAEDREPAPEDKVHLEGALKLTREWAGRYQFSLPGDDAAVQFREQPILQWSNPERGEIYGNVFLWTQKGRPVVVGSLFKWFSPFKHMSHEFHSLAPGGLSAVRDGENVWRTETPGAVLAPLAGAPEVADSPALRLVQMRRLAREFSGRERQRDGQVVDLRLLPQPVYRYELPAESESPIDGGLFVMVQGTDPELWLMLEAVRSAQDTPLAWHYAVARMNSIPLEVGRNDKELFRFEEIPWRDIQSHRQPYTSFRFDQAE